MFDGSHNFAITFLCAEGSVQANISSRRLANGKLYPTSATYGTLYTRSQCRSKNCV